MFDIDATVDSFGAFWRSLKPRFRRTLGTWECDAILSTARTGRCGFWAEQRLSFSFYLICAFLNTAAYFSFLSSTVIDPLLESFCLIKVVAERYHEIVPCGEQCCLANQSLSRWGAGLSGVRYVPHPSSASPIPSLFDPVD
jgi:hypothetical protein